MKAVEKRRLGEGVYGASAFNYRYADSAGRFEQSYGSERPIRYGDRLMARLVLRGRTVVEFFINEVSDFSELMGELRKKAKGVRGLVKMYVRNISQGWSMERPLMLYVGTGLQSDPCHRKSSSSASSSRMLFPWETH